MAKRKSIQDIVTWLLIAGILVAGLVVVYMVYVRRPRLARENAMGPQAHMESYKPVERYMPNRPHWLPNAASNENLDNSLTRVTVSVNSQKFRGRDFHMDKEDGVFRVAVVGECVAFGYGVKDDEPYPALLEKALNEQDGNIRYEVYNFSVMGVPPERVTALLKLFALEYKPDLVLLAPGTDTVYLPEHHTLPVQLDLGEERYGYLLDAYKKILSDAVESCRKKRIPIVLITPTFSSFVFPDFVRWYDSLKEFSKVHKVPLFDTVAIVDRVERERGLVVETSGGRQRLVQHRDHKPVVLVDVAFEVGTAGRHVAPEIYQLMEDNPGIRPAIQIDENHLTPDGHSIVARELLEFLKQRRLLPQEH
jgi:hypothetical protein